MPAHARPDWVSNPYRTVDQIFENNSELYVSDPERLCRDIAAAFQAKTFDDRSDYRYFIPSVQSWKCPRDIPRRTLVHFRCMIQNEQSSAYHQPFVQIRNSTSGEVRTVCGLFKHHVALEENQMCLANSDPRSLFLVQSFKCVPVPGETQWVQDLNTLHDSARVSTSDCTIIAHFFGSAADGIRINEMYDIFGIVYGGNPDKAPEAVEPLHMAVYFARKRAHSHPELSFNTAELNGILHELRYLRPTLLEFLRSFVQGDIVAAEYLLIHLLSSTYGSRDGLPIGNCSLNLINFADRPEFAARFKAFISEIIPKARFFSLGIATLNNARMCPKLDVESSDTEQELLPGILQLTGHTHLIIDETTMDAGTLNDAGVKNLLALQKLATEQKMDIDYFTQQVEFAMDTPVFVLSHGRSLIECRYVVPVKPDNSYTETVLSDDTVKVIRKYLTAAKFASYEIDEDMRKEIVDDFVEKRKTDRNMSGILLHNQLELARYVCISHGDKALTSAHWNHVQMLEKERIDRMKPSINP
ncbi:mini-chromosome maintenance complex-binding protein-like [Paramacrobiotus metropolitanus]|uniref:mini-chromosome maintenance complex-binding protein-like n=1 Tax=Paramacrobiotus metropolitanus TaxID=2943436 RepID=UPI002446135E|nr:mini-chromosome maintenance complex-binding protein-like [Paramacrobiotus metropolitanus]XP_055337669.1 mini-chromosome maintenance complex-binding protein-like [Paramacrobiotus metropolitanus]